uniref:Homologous recombination OB-fold protein OB-fold domain-containing protein n=1 Tax=Monopterus albus TaxID=43700 RepID=A0A3Q3J177_MONAL
MSLLLLPSIFSVVVCVFSQDVLGTDWAVPTASGPADVTAAVSFCALRASSAAHRIQEKNWLQQTGERSAALCNDTASRNGTHTVALGLKQLSSSSSVQPPSSRPPTQNNSQPVLASQQSHANTQGSMKPCVAQDDFDDWDVDLADLDECDGQMGQPLQTPAPTPPVLTAGLASSAKVLRPPTCGGIQTRPEQTLRDLKVAQQPLGSSSHSLPHRTLSASHVTPSIPHPTFPSAPPQCPGVFPGFSATSLAPSPISRTFPRPQQPQRSQATLGPSPQARGLFETVSQAPLSSPSVSSSTLSPHLLRTPVFTNRLVQLVSASSKTAKKRPRCEPHRPRSQCFPGPAGLLQQQPQGHSLDDIVVSVPQAPAHGAVARLPSQVMKELSQTDEDEFRGGAWAAMKAEMGLDERNPSCFLHSYSVVMVLRKAALKQLAKNKVPNMAVLLKSIIHTHADAKAVFKDPTGEIQGTVHRCLLEDRVEELKLGAVLLLKQVSVFSPSHRNHYLNVTSHNLLRIYAPDGVRLSSTQLPPLVLVSTTAFNDDLDELLGELPEDTYSF